MTRQGHRAVEALRPVAAGSTERVGPLEQTVLEILCGKFNKGPWPPPDGAWREAGKAIENAGGRVSFEDSREFVTPADWVNAFAELARDHDEAVGTDSGQAGVRATEATDGGQNC